MRRFVEREIAPHVDAWDEAGSFPRELYAKAADAGLIGLGYPEHLGGTPAAIAWRLIATEEVARAGSGGLLASLFSHSIGLPPIVAHGSDALQRRIVPDVLAGRKIAALAITEPGAGSDVARIACRARRDGDAWVIDGEKAFITSGLRADWLTVAVRTGGPGASGISLIAVPGDAPGLERTPLAKMGWWCSDTARLAFAGCRVPAEQPDRRRERRLSRDHGQLQRRAAADGDERRAPSPAVCFDEALAWARQRKTFGQPLVEHQVVRHKLVDMRMRIFSAHAWIESLVDRYDAGAARRRRRRRALPAQEPRDADDAVLRRPGGADPRRDGLRARHQERADLPRGEGDDDRRRQRGDHEGAGGAPARACEPRRRARA